ncbi:ferritin [Solitalea koreensis]|uniref:Ferritin n=1 Tax=Solitalea koreensis TaxID=543615 RepID=A0A521DIZ3_9SPHI|nr:ferritin [Solitalea koreensis]SMO71687.1 ferritin [Solitalea koreensis]
MKTALRFKTSLQENIQDLLNDQIAMEAHSSSAYLAMSAWCHVQGLQGTANFYRKQSGEERNHMMKIFDYIADAGGHPISPDVKDIPKNFNNLHDLLLASLEMEVKITESFNKIVEQCNKSRDFQTARFLDWFLDEQLEEEKTARRAIELYELIGTEGTGLFRIDHEIEKLGLE